MRWFALAVTDRRWAPPLAGMALGFGLFIGVAVGPNTVGSQATPAPMIVQVDEPAPKAAVGGRSRPESPGGAVRSGGSPITSAPATPTPAPVLPAPAPLDPPAPPPPAVQPEPDPKPDPQEQPAPEEGTTLTGTIAHVNPAAGSYTLAASGGALYAIHAKRSPEAGVRVELPVRELANNTYAEEGKATELGERRQVELAGTVTFVDTSPQAPAYTLSGAGASVLVHVDPPADPAALELPEVGAFALISAAIEKPPPAEATVPPAPEPGAEAPASAGACVADPARESEHPIEPNTILRERRFEPFGDPSTFSGIAGIVAGVCADTDQLLISADDIRASRQDLTLQVPGEIDPTVVKRGESVAATATIAEDGSLTVTGLASDEQLNGADDSRRAQGDLAQD